MNIWQSELDAQLLKERLKGGAADAFAFGSSTPEKVRSYFNSRNTAEDGFNDTAPVDTYGVQNAFGFYNMVGNVWEWTSSRWEERAKGGPPVEPNTMVKKGGSYLCNPFTCNRFRCSSRMMFTADSAASNVGFRCAYPA